MAWLVCEGRCNPKIHVANEIIAKRGRADAGDYGICTLGEGEIALLRSLVHTPHTYAERGEYGKARWACDICGERRSWGT